MINPAGLARAENLDIERFFKTPYVMHPEYEDRLEWLGWKLGQPNRVLNRHLAYSMVYSTTLRQPWTKLADEIARVRNQYESLGWEHLIDPFGSIIFFRNVYWQLKPNNSMLRQVYIQDGRLRLTTLVVRILKSSVKDRDIPAFLTNVERELYDPFSEKPMRWDSKKGRIYFMTGEDGCSIAPFRVPVWDVKGGRQPPKPAEWAIC